MQRFTSATWSPASQIAKRFGSFAAACSCFRIQRPKAWNVETNTSAPARARERRDPLAHLARGLVRERDGEDLLWIDALLEQVGDAVDDDAGLAGAGAGEDEERPLGGGDGLALRWVERREVQHRSRAL